MLTKLHIPNDAGIKGDYVVSFPSELASKLSFLKVTGNKGGSTYETKRVKDSYVPPPQHHEAHPTHFL